MSEVTKTLDVIVNVIYSVYIFVHCAPGAGYGGKPICHLVLDHMGLVGEDMRMRTLFLLGVRRLRPVQEEGDRVELEP